MARALSPLRLFAAALLACASSQALAQEAADLLLTNGEVVTMDPDHPFASAVAVRDGRIVAVGGAELSEAYTAPETIDLAGRTLMPGFIDTHIHIIGQAPRAIAAGKARSIAQLQEMVRAKARELGPGEWITGYGWDEAQMAEGRNPLRADLDAAAPDNPVALTRAGHHSIVGNSLALAKAGIDAQTPDPEHGLIERGADGVPNGLVRERTDLFLSHVPPATSEEMKPSWTAELMALLPLGITSLMEALSTIDDEPVDKGGLAPEKRGAVHTWRQFREIYAAHGTELPRTTMYIVYPGAERLKRFPWRTGHGDDRLKIGPIGEAPGVDGGFTGPTAWTLADYKGMEGFRGRLAIEPDALEEMVRTSRDLGWQMGIHAIGDAAIERLIDVYAAALDEKPLEDHRWFSSHLTMLPPEATLETMAAHGIWGAAQPNFLYNLEGRYQQTLEGRALTHINPLGSPLRHGVKMVLGSDNLPIGPLYGVYVAVTRKAESGTAYAREEEDVSRMAALAMYTREAAYLSFDEDNRGTITPGKFADLVVLDRNLLTVPEEEILATKVDLTLVDGKVLYRR
ncbi:amidohydrolase [Novosphingobium mangrovi (ex Hu et al. 2023)]|uniref:Amidohydrolase n=1 Tax=Novosphingobium mangrovi (ex Hu et al. 2023) TaxID=2930094 RepID=A0ABT0AE19_9SPHN|nr:amidohydrolase [Novosphingobium mangrovi (ex Hu et al. 2023)]MCJ1961450.1 amidohydrolase [Novosphingobium mangrovi (ex Hu et al. 2023)]